MELDTLKKSNQEGKKYFICHKEGCFTNKCPNKKFKKMPEGKSFKATLREDTTICNMCHILQLGLLAVLSQ
jgi:hypothetical protein